MTFMAVMDFNSSQHSTASSYLPLRVKKDLETIPGMEIAITKLNRNGNNAMNHFFNTGYTGITFKCSILIKAEDTWNNKPVVDVIHDWYKNMTPLSVVTNSMNVPNGQYIISKNPSRKEHYKNRTEWDLEFTTYVPLVLFKYKNDNSNVLKALKKNKTNAKKKSSKKKNNALAKCNYKTLKYSSKKKTVKCVETLQKLLKKKKYYSAKVDGWYGKETLKAVKKFQKKYNKKNVKSVTTNGYTGIKALDGKLVTNTKNANVSLPKGTKITKKSSTNKSTIVKVKGINKVLPTNGKVDKATFNALCNL